MVIKKIIVLFTCFCSLIYCVGQNENIDNTKKCNTSKSIDELYAILYGDNRDLRNQSHQRIVLDTLEMDSIKFVFYPNGALCYEQWFVKGNCKINREYYSNGQIFVEQIANKGTVNAKTESFPIDYGKYCYLYGFKVYRRIHVSYFCDGSPWYISFLGIFHNKKVLIDIEFMPYNQIIGAWIYEQKNNKLYKQFDWDDITKSWKTPTVNHVINKKSSYRNKALYIMSPKIQTES